MSDSNLHYPRVAVVILNWNGRDLLEQFLPSVAQTSYPNLDIYIADNHSDDDSVTFVQAHYPQFKIIQNDKNYGFAEGYNKALQKVEADYFVLLNSDVEVTPNWVTEVIKLMETDGKIAACQPKIRAKYNKSDFEYAGAAGGWIDIFGYPFCRGRFFDVCETDVGQYDDVCDVFWATGAALFLKADIFRQLKGLDGDFFAHMEEIDLCWRIQRAGYRIVYCPNSVVYHLGGGSLPKNSPFKTYLNFRNNLVMLFKNYQRWQLFLLFPIRLLLDVVAIFQALFSGQTANVQAIIKAEWHFYKDIIKWWRKRKETQKCIQKIHPNSQKNRLSGVYKGSIIIAYFLRKKRYFHELFSSNNGNMPTYKKDNTPKDAVS